MKKIYCFSEQTFKNIMDSFGFYKNGSNLFDTLAVISICDTEDGLSKEHYFNNNTENIINLDFDDIDPTDDTYKYYYRTSPENHVIINGRIWKEISDEQASDLVKFIVQNKERTFIIHCYAGISRSVAVTKFILDILLDHEVANEIDFSNMNSYVYEKLKENFEQLCQINYIQL